MADDAGRTEMMTIREQDLMHHKIPVIDYVKRLKRLGDSAQPLSIQSLTNFSNIDRESVTELRNIWQHISDERRIEIVQALVSLGEDAVDLNFYALFVMCLDDDNEQVRALAIDGLWEDERPETLRLTLRLSTDPSGLVRAAVMRNLSRFAYYAELGELPDYMSDMVYTTLMQAIQDDDQPLNVRRRALESIGYYSQPEEVHIEIGKAYEHPEQFMRESALLAMGRSMQPDWLPVIERALQSTSPALRLEATRAIGEFEEEAQHMVSSLLPMIDDTDIEVAQAALDALGKVGGPHARRVLERVAGSKDDVRAEAAYEALEYLRVLEDDDLF